MGRAPAAGVIGTPLAPEVFEVLDALWLQEDRIGEITLA